MKVHKGPFNLRSVLNKDPKFIITLLNRILDSMKMVSKQVITFNMKYCEKQKADWLICCNNYLNFRLRFSRYRWKRIWVNLISRCRVCSMQKTFISLNSHEYVVTHRNTMKFAIIFLIRFYNQRHPIKMKFMPSDDNHYEDRGDFGLICCLSGSCYVSFSSDIT